MAYKPAIMSASLGRAWLHDLDYKIAEASKAGFKGIEIFYEDLEYLARKLSKSENPTTDQLLSAASHIHGTCQRSGLEIIGLQPFLFYEGLKDREQHARLIEKMRLWLRLAKTLHTTTIQIPANFLPAEELVDDIDVIVSDLREVADLGAAETPVVRFAYENLCWSTHIDTVEKLWDVVRRVDRPNFGMCLDTFNIAGRVWADPASVTGKTPDADADLKRTIEWMVREVDVSKVFYIQVVDAERLKSPLVAGHEFHVEGQPARMNWSRNARTFMYETARGAYLPVEGVAKAIIHGLGYKGYVSMELFSRTMSEEGSHVPVEHAERGIRAWKRFEERMQLN
ncbi:sugar phosphate isomerase/epimerase family protein [Aspergillus lucknowensis]|uniref:Xylose isomerase-like protein n=1 Tax=Aspergillus lucknowensis TaxID=176173 RepID=A0ABR4LR71_9EURO